MRPSPIHAGVLAGLGDAVTAAVSSCVRFFLPPPPAVMAEPVGSQGRAFMKVFNSALPSVGLPVFPLYGFAEHWTI